jgi:hypothetical protein
MVTEVWGDSPGRVAVASLYTDFSNLRGVSAALAPDEQHLLDAVMVHRRWRPADASRFGASTPLPVAFGD